MKKKEILLEAMTHEVLTALEHFSLIKINRTKINEIHPPQWLTLENTITTSIKSEEIFNYSPFRLIKVEYSYYPFIKEFKISKIQSNHPKISSKEIKKARFSYHYLPHRKSPLFK